MATDQTSETGRRKGNIYARISRTVIIKHESGRHTVTYTPDPTRPIHSFTCKWCHKRSVQYLVTVTKISAEKIDIDLTTSRGMMVTEIAERYLGYTCLTTNPKCQENGSTTDLTPKLSPSVQEMLMGLV